MPIPAAVKKFLLTWVIPPGVEAARRRRQIPPLQKFWSRSPLPVPSRERDYFLEHGLSSATTTRDDDTRPAALVDRESRLRLPDGAQGQTVQFAVTSVGRWPDSACLRTGIDGTVTTHGGLSPDRWLDIRLDVTAGAQHLELRTDASVYVSCPRAVRVGSGHGSKPNHVIVLVLDGWTTRLGDTRHPTEPGVSLTPNIDRFFSGGFEAPNGYATGEWTLPTAASFFTGVCTARHQAFRPYAPTQLPADRPVLAEYFQAAGFHTLCMSVANRLSPAYGHHRGFDRFIYHFPEPGFTCKAYDPAVWIQELVGHLATHRSDRTFSYLHLPDVHPVWDIPPLSRAFNLGRRGNSTGLALRRVRGVANAGEQGRQLYLLRLHEVDRALAPVFDYVDRFIPNDALVVLTADHGTPWSYLRSNRPSDEPVLVDDRTAISLRMRGPNVPKRRLERLTAPTLDLMPTLLARVGLPTPPDLDGQDLLDAGYHRDFLVSESMYGGVYEIALRDGRHAYIEKYPLDEQAVRVTGPAVYQRLFPAGCSDYSQPLNIPADGLVQAAHAHIRHHLSEGLDP